MSKGRKANLEKDGLVDRIIRYSAVHYCVFTPQAARASKWPEVLHFQCEPAASSGESSAFWTMRASRRVEIRSTLW